MAQTQTTHRTYLDEAEALKTAAADRITDAAAQAQDKVHDATTRVRDTAVETAERGLDTAQTLQSDFDSAVRRNPTLAVLGAVGVGMVLGLALTKRG